MSQKHFYPRADAKQQPTPWWYFGRAVYVSRHEYAKIFNVFAATGVAIGAANVLLKRKKPLQIPFALAGVGVAMLGYSLIGLYRMYGHPAVEYLERLLRLGNVTGKVTVADLHIGTYRHAYLLAELLPEATIETVDCINAETFHGEEAVSDVRDLEPAPEGNYRIHPHKATNDTIPLGNGSVDVVVFGFGTHEIPVEDGTRDRLFREANRILKHGGTILMFEHGYDFHNYAIFGPVIKHVTARREWEQVLRQYFDELRIDRTSHAVDLYAAKRRSDRAPE